MHEFKIGKNDCGQRLDKFLSKAADMPASLLYKAIRKKKIKLNRKRCEGSDILSEGDTVQCFLPEELFSKDRGSSAELSRITPSLSVIYEDSNILLVNKRPGVSVHEDEDGASDTLIMNIKAYLYGKGEYDPEAEQSFAPALCNRIDRNTGGIVIAAKNAEALRVMNDKIRKREIDKFYLCAVHGVPSPARATLRAYLVKDENSKTVRVFDRDPPRGAKEIRTRYRVLSVRGGLSLLEVELLTGRTHQIRAHMAHIGHPLLGDGKYGSNREDRRRGFAHQALCSYKIRFSFDKSESTVLDYLSGKEFTIPSGEIYFLSEFPGYKL